MPVIDGFKACEMIRQVYSDNKYVSHPSSSGESGERSEASNKQFWPPIICANSAYIDETIRKKTVEMKFDMCFCSMKAT